MEIYHRGWVPWVKRVELSFIKKKRSGVNKGNLRTMALGLYPETRGEENSLLLP